MAKPLHSPLMGSRREVNAVDPWRWWMLFWLSSLTFSQGWIWNTWGPVSQVAIPMFGWTEEVIATMGNWGPIAYMVGVVPTAYYFDSAGLRTASLVAAFCVAAGCGVRLLALLPNAAHDLILYSMHTGQFLNGLAGPVAMMAGPPLSAAWFPPHFRTTSTATVAIFNGLGVAFSNMVGPALIPASADAVQQRLGLAWYMWGSFAVAVLIFIAMLVHFPDRPVNAPSITASMPRTDFGQGVRDIFQHGNWWLLGGAYGVMTGISSAWSTVLSIDLKGIVEDPDDVAGSIGFWGGLLGQLAGLLASAFSDASGGNKRVILLVLCVLSVITVLWFTILCKAAANRFGHTGVGSDSGSDIGGVGTAGVIWQLYFAPIVLFGCQGACFPIFYEMGVEAAFPIAEGLSMGVLTFLTNIFSLVFLALPVVGLSMGIWLNWAVLGGCAYALLAVLLFRETYVRSDIDQGVAYGDRAKSVQTHR